MSEELTVQAFNAPGSLATVLGVSPKQLMDYAIEIATTLKAVLTDRGMTKKFGAGEHVLTEGWQLAGSLLGLTASERLVIELPDGSFEATVELKSVASGRIIAVASGRCGVDEPNWKSKPKYARRSMAFTRAIGRAYAQNFRWLIKLAGYEGTPAEEMPGFAPIVTYSNTNVDHKRWLWDELINRAVPQDDWKSVSDRLNGRSVADLDQVINQERTS